MLAVGPAMDGEFPQHEPPPAGGILYSPPLLQTPLCGSGVQVSPRHPRSASGGTLPSRAGAAAASLSRASSRRPGPRPGRGTPRGARLPSGLFAKAVTGLQGDAQAWAAAAFPAGQGLGPL